MKRRAFLESLSTVAALEPATAKLVPDVTVRSDIEYTRSRGSLLRLDLHLSAKPSTKLPVVMTIHGGAFRSGNKRGAPGLFLAKHGFAVASIDYHLSQSAIFPAQIYECKAAVRWLRAHAGEYNLDARRIGVIGSSAGGLFANLLGTTADNKQLEGDLGDNVESSRVDAVADLWGPSDLLTLEEDARLDPHVRPKMSHNTAGSPEAQLLGGPVQSRLDMAQLASPIRHITAKTCPFLLLHGDCDPLIPVKQSYRLFEALRKARIESNLFIGAGFGHGVRTPETEAMIATFFERHLCGT
jgi:acetyl esterase/lipase